MEVISALSPTLQRLHLAVDTSEIAPELKLPVPLELPKLTTLKLELKQAQASEAATLEHLVAAFSSAPITDLSIAAAWASPKASLAIIGNTFPTLRTISLQPSALTAKDFALVSAFCARRGLAPPTHTPFDDKEIVRDISDTETDVLCDGIDQLLEYGRLQVARVRAGGSAAVAVRLLNALRPLDADRRDWLD